MIVSKLQGGLCNQIFQWAYGKHLSVKYNTPLYLDIAYYKQNLPGTTKREYSLNKFPNLINIDTKFSSDKLLGVSDDFNFKELKYNSNYDYYLSGFWQSEKYFIESSDIIRKELSPNISNEKIKLPLLNSNSVSMHIRRTDYIKSNGYHPVLPVEYYKKAIDIIGKYDYIFVFSDDIEWCKSNLKFNNIIYVEGFDDVEDLWIMSMCKNNIIANSSFSWWGAWLNLNINKKVIAPKNWFGQHVRVNQSDLIPDSWIKI